MIGKPPGNPINVNPDQVLQEQGFMTNNQDQLKMQVVNMFQEANFFGQQ